jgi:ADP-heptose:LPS heptosyltransferase
MRRILILRGGALGDFIVTLPALAALRSAYPAARIELAGNAPAAALAVARGLLDAAHSQHESRWAALYDSAPLPPTFGAWLTSFDLVLNFWPDPDATLARHFQNLSVPIFLTSSAHPNRAPAAAHYCEPLRTLGLPKTNFFYPLLARAKARPPRESDLSALNSRRLASPTIALHPGSGSTQKTWPLENWLSVLQSLAQTQPLHIVLITGEAEAERGLLPILNSLTLPNLTFESWHQIPLPDLVPRLPARAQAGTRFHGHDTGNSHHAAASPTSPTTTRSPRSGRGNLASGLPTP